jgi:hypothetical protein
MIARMIGIGEMPLFEASAQERSAVNASDHL